MLEDVEYGSTAVRLSTSVYVYMHVLDLVVVLDVDLDLALQELRRLLPA